MKARLPHSLLALAIVAFAFTSCEKNSLKSEEIPADGINVIETKADNGIVWNGEPDKAVAVNIQEVVSPRTNASGIKIPSNAHSADFPGLYFIWSSKQKDNGYLKVAAWVFDKYESFVLTSKESNTYWDFLIAVQPDQQKTGDDCYVFFIPKVYNNKNINMVFLSEFTEKTEKEVDVNPVGGVNDFTSNNFGSNGGSTLIDDDYR